MPDMPDLPVVVVVRATGKGLMRLPLFERVIMRVQGRILK
jgi:hypothetical protein